MRNFVLLRLLVMKETFFVSCRYCNIENKALVVSLLFRQLNVTIHQGSSYIHNLRAYSILTVVMSQSSDA